MKMDDENPADLIKQPLYPPARFGFVNPGVYRGGFPLLPNFRFLDRLQIKTIISIVPEEPTQDLYSFAEMTGATLVHIAISRNAPMNDNLKSILIKAVNICLDPSNHPVYIHCLDGRRMTSLVVLLLRRIQGWAPLTNYSEFWRYEITNRSPLIPSSEIGRITKELERFCVEVKDVVLPEHCPGWLWNGDASVAGLSGVKLLSESVSEAMVLSAESSS